MSQAFSPQPPGGGGDLGTIIQITLKGVPSMTDSDYTNALVSANTPGTLKIYKEGVRIKTCYDKMSCWVTVPLNFGQNTITGTGTAEFEGRLLTDTETKHTYSVPDDDIVRNDNNNKILSLRDEVYEYTRANYPSYVSGSFDTAVEKIRSLDHFAADILLPLYKTSDITHPETLDTDNPPAPGDWRYDTDAMKAWEVAEDFANFDGSTDTSSTFDYSTTNRGYDCRDFAALLSGLAKTMGLYSRIVSLSDSGYNGQVTYDHMFAEVYGIEAGNNHGWYMIDPGHTDYYFNSESNFEQRLSELTMDDGAVCRLWIIGGWTAGWGLDIAGTSIPEQNAWYFPVQDQQDRVPPLTLDYLPSNPFGIDTTDTSSCGA